MAVVVVLTVKKVDSEWKVSVIEGGRRVPEADYHAGAGDKDAKSDALSTAQAMGQEYKAKGYEVEIRSK